MSTRKVTKKRNNLVQNDLVKSAGEVLAKIGRRLSGGGRSASDDTEAERDAVHPSDQVKLQARREAPEQLHKQEPRVIFSAQAEAAAGPSSEASDDADPHQQEEDPAQQPQVTHAAFSLFSNKGWNFSKTLTALSVLLVLGCIAIGTNQLKLQSSYIILQHELGSIRSTVSHVASSLTKGTCSQGEVNKVAAKLTAHLQEQHQTQQQTQQQVTVMQKELTTTVEELATVKQQVVQVQSSFATLAVGKAGRSMQGGAVASCGISQLSDRVGPILASRVLQHSPVVGDQETVMKFYNMMLKLFKTPDQRIHPLARQVTFSTTAPICLPLEGSYSKFEVILHQPAEVIAVSFVYPAEGTWDEASALFETEVQLVQPSGAKGEGAVFQSVGEDLQCESFRLKGGQKTSRLQFQVKSNKGHSKYTCVPKVLVHGRHGHTATGV